MTERPVSPGWRFLEGLDPKLDGQRRLLQHLLTFSESDAGVVWLTIGCSLVRGNADALSDLDVAMGIVDDTAADRLKGGLSGFGNLVASFEHPFPGAGRTHRRLFAQFADRTQIDLVFGVAGPVGLPGAVVLYDRDGVVRTEIELQSVSGDEDVESWAALGYVALLDLGKYLRRGSLFEAHSRLEAARDYLWRLWAVAEAVVQPEYGMTSILDAEHVPLPPGIEATVAGLDLEELSAAGLRLATALSDVVARCGTAANEVTGALGRFVLADLCELATRAEPIG